MKIVKGTAKSVALSVVYLAVALVMYSAMKNTRPSQLQHANAVTDVVEHVVDDIFENRIEIPAESRDLADYISTTVVPKALEKVQNGKIDLTDFWIFNVGSITDENGEEEAVSIGILGKVFTFNEEKIRENIEETVTQDMNEFLSNGNSVECDEEVQEPE